MPMTRRPVNPIVVLFLALIALVGAQALSQRGIEAALRPESVLCYGVAALAAVLARRGSPHAPLVILLAAAGGVRCMYTAQPTTPLPMVAWARGTGLEPPQRLFPLFFSGSVFGVGQISAIVLWTGAMAAAGLPKRPDRLPAVVLAMLGAFGTVACMLMPLPMLENELATEDDATTQAERVPAWVDKELVERVWVRRTVQPAPSIRRSQELMDSEIALIQIAQGMGMSTHGRSLFRAAEWRATEVLTRLQMQLRAAALVSALLSLPICVGLTMRSAARSRVLALPGQVLLWILAAGNIVIGLLACLLPEGGLNAVQALPYHFALLGFVAAAALAAKQLRLGPAAPA